MSGFRALTESLILAIVIAAGNALFGSTDPGWFSLNPTPYLLIPMLVGMRYGFMTGLISGLITAVIVALAPVVFGGKAIGDVVSQSPFMLLSLPGIGVLSGEVRRALAGRFGGVAARADSLETDVARLRAELALTQEAQGQLQERLALHGAKFSAADVELRKRFEAEAGPVLPGMLEALDTLCDAQSTAFYRRGANNELELEHAYGDTARFPARLEGGDAEMALAALDAEELATPHGLLDGERPAGECIAALPWAGGGDRVLVIGEMPFEAVTWQNLARIEVFCRWVAETERATERGETLLGSAELRERIDLAGETASEQGVPSAVVLLTAAAGLAGGVDQAALEQAVLPQLGAADVAGTVGRDEPHLAVLLPMGGARDAVTLVDAAGDSLGCDAFLIRSSDSVEEVWKALTDVA